MEELGAEFWPPCPPSSTPPDPWEEGRAAWELGVRGKSGRRLLALGLERRRAGLWGFLNPPLCVKPVWGWWCWLGGTLGATRLGRGTGRQHDDPSSARAGPDFRLGPGRTLGIRSVNATTRNDLWEHVAERFPRRTWADGVTSHLRRWRQTGARGLLNPPRCITPQTPEHVPPGLSGFRNRNCDSASPLRWYVVR